MKKLNLSLQHRFQLAIQQSEAIGSFLSAAISEHRSISYTESQEEPRRGRPKLPVLLSILDTIENLSMSASALHDHILLSRTIAHFPTLLYVNEPVSHFLDPDVRTAVKHLADRIHLDCRAPENISDVMRESHYDSSVSHTHRPTLSEPIPHQTVNPCDGDGLVTNIDFTLENPLRDAVWTRFNGIDAPELSTVHFFKSPDLENVFVKRVGHLSLCGLHLFLRMFVQSGSADLCEEKIDEEYESPVDNYGRPLKEFWFRFMHPEVTEIEMNFLNQLEALVPAQVECRQRLMSPFSVTQASTTEPFLLSLNALLVVTGFSHVFTRFHPENRLLALQKIAKENRLGPLWCGATRKCVFGVKCNSREDIVLQNLDENSMYGSCVEKYLPWHEREACKKLCSNKVTRGEANENLTKALPRRPPACGVCFDIRYV